MGGEVNPQEGVERKKEETESLVPPVAAFGGGPRAALKMGAALVGAAFAVGLVVACGGGGTTPACNNGDTRPCVGAGGCSGGQSCAGGAWSACDCGGTNDSGADGSTATDGATSDAADGGLPDITPYLKNCPQVAGTAPMVEIPAQGGGSFCIDTREVTADEFVKWKNSGNKDNPPNCPALQSSACGGGNETPNVGALPADCVGWCEAYSFCSVAGKRLCNRTEFVRACEGTRGDFSWGEDFGTMTGQCFGLSPLPKAGATNCHTPEVPFGFANELANGLIEWTNDVNPPPVSAKGQRSGGMTQGTYAKGSPVCAVITENIGLGNTSYAGFKNTGFRCCAKAN